MPSENRSFDCMVHGVSLLAIDDDAHNQSIATGLSIPGSNIRILIPSVLLIKFLCSPTPASLRVCVCWCCQNKMSAAQAEAATLSCRSVGAPASSHPPVLCPMCVLLCVLSLRSCPNREKQNHPFSPRANGSSMYAAVCWAPG